VNSWLARLMSFWRRASASLGDIPRTMPDRVAPAAARTSGCKREGERRAEDCSSAGTTMHTAYQTGGHKGAEHPRHCAGTAAARLHDAWCMITADSAHSLVTHTPWGLTGGLGQPPAMMWHSIDSKHVLERPRHAAIAGCCAHWLVHIIHTSLPPPPLAAHLQGCCLGLGQQEYGAEPKVPVGKQCRHTGTSEQLLKRAPQIELHCSHATIDICSVRTQTLVPRFQPYSL
jgi:hypothetical protein